MKSRTRVFESTYRKKENAEKVAKLLRNAGYKNVRVVKAPIYEIRYEGVALGGKIVFPK
jgi:hypothetical protein